MEEQNKQTVDELLKELSGMAAPHRLPHALHTFIHPQPLIHSILHVLTIWTHHVPILAANINLANDLRVMIEKQVQVTESLTTILHTPDIAASSLQEQQWEHMRIRANEVLASIQERRNEVIHQMITNTDDICQQTLNILDCNNQSPQEHYQEQKEHIENKSQDEQDISIPNLLVDDDSPDQKPEEERIEANDPPPRYPIPQLNVFDVDFEDYDDDNKSDTDEDCEDFLGVSDLRKPQTPPVSPSYNDLDYLFDPSHPLFEEPIAADNVPVDIISCPHPIPDGRSEKMEPAYEEAREKLRPKLEEWLRSPSGTKKGLLGLLLSLDQVMWEGSKLKDKPLKVEDIATDSLVKKAVRKVRLETHPDKRMRSSIETRIIADFVFEAINSAYVSDMNS